MASSVPIQPGTATQGQAARPVSSTSEASEFDSLLSGLLRSLPSADPGLSRTLPGSTTKPLPAGNDNGLPNASEIQPGSLELSGRPVSEPLLLGPAVPQLSGSGPEESPIAEGLPTPTIALHTGKIPKSVPGIRTRTGKASPADQTPPSNMTMAAPDLANPIGINIPSQTVPPAAASRWRENGVQKAGELPRVVPSGPRDEQATSASPQDTSDAASGKFALKYDAVSDTIAPTTISSVPPAVSLEAGPSPVSRPMQEQPVQPPDHAAPVNQVAPALVGILKAADGTTSMTVHLQPVELGQVRIHIDQTTDGAARIDITAERPETLQLLQRDEPRLQQVLDQAGMLSTGRTISFQIAAPDQVGAAASRPDSMEAGSGGYGQGQSGGAWRQNDDSPGGSSGNPQSDQGQGRTRWFRAGLDITA
jgi:hypothetical protein